MSSRPMYQVAEFPSPPTNRSVVNRIAQTLLRCVSLGYWGRLQSRGSRNSAAPPGSAAGPTTAPTAFNPAMADEPPPHTNAAQINRILSLTTRQLADLDGDVERSVVQVCEGFQGMTQRAQSAVAAAETAVGTAGNRGSSSGLISEMKSALETLTGNIQHSSQFTQKVSLDLAKLERNLDAVERTLRDVEQISNKARLVALNGQIEAARLGAAGTAFQVVSRETKMLASYASETADAIRSHVAQLAGELRTLANHIQRQAALDAETIQVAETRVTQLLFDLDAAHQQMVQSLGETATISGELRSDIGRAVQAMQFQDRVSQRINHVVETLQDLMERLETASSTSDIAPDDNWLERMESRYTMDSERRIHTTPNASAAAAISASTAPANTEENFSVELF